MKFYYKARKKQTSDLREGVINAKDEQAAVADLLRHDLIAVEIVLHNESIVGDRKVDEASIEQITRQSYRLKDYLFFFRHTADLLDAGFPLLKCLDMVAKECSNFKFAVLIEQLKAYIQEGGFLSEAMARFPKAFPEYSVALIKSSEVNGQVVSVLRTIADDIEKKWKMQKTIVQSLIYPAIILLVGILAFVVLLVFVLPRITTLFSDFDVLLPLSTRIVMGLSDFLLAYGLYIVLFMAGCVIVAVKSLQDQAVRFQVDQRVLRIPFLGAFLLKMELTRFFRVFGISIQNGVDLVVAFKVSLGVLSNQFLKQEFGDVLSQVTDGEKLSNAFKRIEYFPESFYGLLAMGEQKASLGSDFLKIAYKYDEEVQDYSQKCVDLVGPLVLIGVVLFVGGVLVSVMMPILQMNMSI